MNEWIHLMVGYFVLSFKQLADSIDSDLII